MGLTGHFRVGKIPYQGNKIAEYQSITVVNPVLAQGVLVVQVGRLRKHWERLTPKAVTAFLGEDRKVRIHASMELETPFLKKVTKNYEARTYTAFFTKGFPSREDFDGESVQSILGCSPICNLSPETKRQIEIILTDESGRYAGANIVESHIKELEKQAHEKKKVFYVNLDDAGMF